MHIDIPAPKYTIGSIVIALINHQPRYARLEQAHMNTHIKIDRNGTSLVGKPRWEYDAQVFSEPIEESEMMIIAERSIITVVDVNETDED